MFWCCLFCFGGGFRLFVDSASRLPGVSLLVFLALVSFVLNVDSRLASVLRGVKSWEGVISTGARKYAHKDMIGRLLIGATYECPGRPGAGRIAPPTHYPNSHRTYGVRNIDFVGDGPPLAGLVGWARGGRGSAGMCS